MHEKTLNWQHPTTGPNNLVHGKGTDKLTCLNVSVLLFYYYKGICEFGRHSAKFDSISIFLIFTLFNDIYWYLDRLFDNFDKLMMCKYANV